MTTSSLCSTEQQFDKASWDEVCEAPQVTKDAVGTHLLNSFFTHRATAACGKGCSRNSMRITQFLARDGSSLQRLEVKR